MATQAKSPERLDRIAELQERLDTEFPELTQKAKAEIETLEKERLSFVFRALVEGEPAAQQRLSEIDVSIADARTRLDVIAGEHARVADQVNLLQSEEAMELAGISRETANQLGSEMDAAADEFRGLLFEATRKLLRLKELSAKAQNTLIGHGLTDEAARYAFQGYRSNLSAWVVLCLGRMGKLNLNSPISTDASKEWTRRCGSTA